MRKIVALFPGQGSQSAGMGKSLCEIFPEGKKIFEEANSVLGFNLQELCFNGDKEELKKTAIAQPAILTVSFIAFKVLQELFAEKVEVVGACGHSLGEYSALVAAEALSFKEAVRLVHLRGKFMQEAVAPGKGKMAAIIGAKLSEIEELLLEIKDKGVCEVANINTPQQIVVSGDKGAVDEFLKICPFKSVELSVSAPFHCSLMKPAEEKLACELEKITFKLPKFSVYHNFHAKKADTAQEIADLLRKQVSAPVRWVECVENAFKECGTDEGIEFGNGKVIKGLLRKINPSFKCYSLGEGKDVELLKVKFS